MAELNPLAQTRLRELLVQAFGLDELVTLCQDLGVDYENLPGEKIKEAKCRELVLHMRRIGQVQALLSLCAIRRPNIAWQTEVIHTPPLGAGLRALAELMRHPEVRDIATGAKAKFESARHQIRLMWEYKETHDLLQQLEQHYGLIHMLVYEGGQLLPKEAIRWRSFALNCSALQNTILKLCAHVEDTSFSHVADWVAELQAAGTELKGAQAQQTPDKIDEALQTIYDVVSGQGSRVNGRLIGAIEALNASNLTDELMQVYAGIAPLKVSLDPVGAGQLDEFAQEVSALTDKTQQLLRLKDKHDLWQQLDNDLRVESNMLERDATRLEKQWNRRLKHATHGVCKANDADFAQPLLGTAQRLDTALSQRNLSDAMQLFGELRMCALERFVLVDCDLKQLCSEMERAGGTLDSILEKLR